MSKIAVVIITLNEEENIGRCLDAIIDIADEIIVVDSFSSDNTKIICEKYNVKFISKKWEGYSKTKNFGNALAKSDYILSLDADEVVSERLKLEILKEKSTLNGIYKFNRLTNYAGKWIHFCGWYPDTKVRLFPKEKAKWEGDFVHETLVYEKSLNTKHLKGNLLHYSYKSKKDHLERIEKYSSLHAEAMKNNGKKSSFIKKFLSPIIKFLNDYFLKLGFLDGKTGFIICLLSAKAVYLKYAKLKLLNNTNKTIN